MISMCYVVSYSRCTLAKNVVSRIKALISAGIKVDVICFDGSGSNLLLSFCKENGINVKTINIDNLNLNLSIQNIPFLVSYEIRRMLLNEKYDIIRFTDFMGSAFHCIQGKNVCGEFSNTNLAVDMYGPSQFQNEAGESWGFGGFEQLIVQYMERYCCEFCDSLTSPTNSMFNWAINKRWNLCENRSVISNIYIADTNPIPKPDTSNLIFCGELSKAGGLHLFCNALQRLHQETLSQIGCITFIGEMNKVGDINADEFINKSLSPINLTYNIRDSLLPKDIIDECKRLNGVMVFPQIISNNDIELIAAVSSNTPLIAACSDAHNEVLDNSNIFSSSPAALAKKIQSLEEIDFEKVQHKYNGTIENSKWIELNNTIVTPKISKVCDSKPLVSICMAYYNHGDYLEMALSSIEKIDYSNIEVIIVNDGSTDIKSNQVFEQMKGRFKSPKFRFEVKSNEGPSIARNYAASLANGKYILFMDSDNIAKPNMVSDFVESMETYGFDCLSCYFDQFLGKRSVEDSPKGLTYAMIGPCLELGLFMNCFGDTNFIVKKDVFLKLGGFYKNRVVTEDWQFLSNLCLNGYRMEVVPVPLFWYRVLPESNVSFGSEYFKQQIILETYCKGLPPYVYHAINSLCRPALEPNKLTNIPESTNEFISKTLNILNKILPLHSRRRRLIKRLAIIVMKSKK